MRYIDETNIQDVMPRATSFLNNVESVRGECWYTVSGVSRSTTVVLMYMMQQYHSVCGMLQLCTQLAPFIEPTRAAAAGSRAKSRGRSSVATKSAGKAFTFMSGISVSMSPKKRKGDADDEEEAGRRREQGGCLEYFVSVCSYFEHMGTYMDT